jgi:hypothetical protein
LVSFGRKLNSPNLRFCSEVHDCEEKGLAASQVFSCITGVTKSDSSYAMTYPRYQTSRVGFENSESDASLEPGLENNIPKLPEDCCVVNLGGVRSEQWIFGVIIP